ncbi:MAG: glycoside hydrolase family 65 protein, partial [Deltaproteobacteria bacterium]|nr:glycoside hydrolase family 65 protein [Deltaproteobacteria bacterium]
YDPVREEIYEARFAISNGFLGVRAGREIGRGARWIEPHRTYIAGLFDIPGAEHPIPRLVAAPGWLQVRITSIGEPLVYHPSELTSHSMTLDMRRGVLLTEARLADSPTIAVRARTLRLVSLRERAIGLHLVNLEIEEGGIELTLEASFEGLGLGLVPERLENDLGIWRTRYSGKRLAMAAASSLEIDGYEMAPARPGPFVWSWHWKTRPGQILRLVRLIAVARGDAHDSDAGQVASGKLRAARRLGWRKVVQEHEASWADRWQRSQFEIGGDSVAEQALRFAVYHLNSAANPADERVSIGARGLTGEDYQGHVFWDTEIYLLPFYTLTWPEAARALLMYRFWTIDGARAKAASMGWRGAMYAWECADTGAETTPEQVVSPDGHVIVDILCGKQEQHITADVAYAVWQYWEATRDQQFLLDAGAEIILETGRFWSSRAQRESDGYCHIRGVIGPDEYHEHIDDNAFTNVMARWNIRRALDVAAALRERWPDHWAGLSSRLQLTDTELSHWRTVAETMATGWSPQMGLFEQFAGFFGLEEIDLSPYEGRSVPMDTMLGRQRTQRTKVIKQADVVALLGLLPEEFPGDSAAANFRYYEPRCCHGSSLSAAMHALVAARLGYSEMALRYFQHAVATDLADTHMAIAGGLHMAALGGTWLTAVFGFAGLSLRSDEIGFEPKLPASWRSLGFRIEWRGRRLKIRIDAEDRTLEAMLETGDSMALLVNGEQHELRRDKTSVCPLVSNTDFGR